MSSPATAESRPSPWLTFLLMPLVGICSSVATTSFMAGGKAEQLAAESRRNDTQDAAIAALQSSRTDILVSLGEMKGDLRHQRAQLDNIQTLLSGGISRR